MLLFVSRTLDDGLVFAARDLLRDFEKRLQFWLNLGLTLLVIAVLAWIVHVIRKAVWKNEDLESSPEEILKQYRRLKLEGELSEEEYRRIADKLSVSAKATHIQNPANLPSQTPDHSGTPSDDGAPATETPPANDRPNEFPDDLKPYEF